MLEQIKYREEHQSVKTIAKYGLLQSPNYPLNYEKNTDCVFLIHGNLEYFKWKITNFGNSMNLVFFIIWNYFNSKAPQGQVIQIQNYELFDLEPSGDCEYDYLGN